jgi:hypothetical protein
VNDRYRGLSALPYANHNPNFFVGLDANPLGAKVNKVAALALLTLPTAAAPHRPVSTRRWWSRSLHRFRREVDGGFARR